MFFDLEINRLMLRRLDGCSFLLSWTGIQRGSIRLELNGLKRELHPRTGERSNKH